MRSRNYYIEPTGKPLDLEDTTPSTVCISTDIMKYRVVDRIRERERKLFILLVHAVWHDLGKKNIHKVEIKKIKRVFRKVCSTKSYKDWLWEYLENLSDIKVVYRDEKLRGVTHLFASAYLDDEKEYICFQIPEVLTHAILSANCFARLDTYFLIGLSGKYSVSLYQFLESKVGLDRLDPSLVPNEEDRFIKINLDHLKQFLSIRDGEYSKWVNFRQRVLDPAVKEINTNEMQSTFKVRYETVANNRRKVTDLKFFLEKTPGRLEKENQLRKIKFPKNNPSQSSPKRSNFLSSKSVKDEEINQIATDSSEKKTYNKSKDEEAIKLVAYFEEVRNGVKIAHHDVDERDIIKAKTFLIDIQSFDIAKEIVKIICSFENKPDFFGGLVKHKPRAVALYNEQQSTSKLEEDRLEKDRKKQAEKQAEIETLRKECEEFESTLSEEERAEVEVDIRKGLRGLKLKFYDRDSELGESLRRDEFFNWWLINIKGNEHNSLKNFSV